MTQSRKHSLYESCCNVIIGYVIAVASQAFIFPFWGINIPLRDNLGIGACFTVISLIRSYAIRRWWNAHK